jgi:hypothetical protein
MATFAGITFGERGRGGGSFFPVHGAKSRIAILHAPGGDYVYVQSMGYDAAPLDVPAKVTAAQLASLRGKVGTSDSLVYAGGTITATLESIDAQEVKRPNDVYFATLKFIVSVN